MRNIKLGTPSRFEITAQRLKRTRAVGRENFEKINPVTSARLMRPVSASMLIRIWATNVIGRHLAVADRRHGLDAEEKHVGERAGARVLDASVEHINDREN